MAEEILERHLLPLAIGKNSIVLLPRKVNIDPMIANSKFSESDPFSGPNLDETDFFAPSQSRGIELHTIRTSTLRFSC